MNLKHCTLRSGLLLVLLAILTACGFQLRGDLNLPPEMARTQLQIADEYDPFARELKRLLTRSGVTLVEDDPTALLEIPTNRARREILSVGDSARVREFRVRYRVEFHLTDAAGNVLQPRRTAEQSREVVFDEREILASQREEEYLEEELARTLARQVLRMLEQPAR